MKYWEHIKQVGDRFEAEYEDKVQDFADYDLAVEWLKIMESKKNRRIFQDEFFAMRKVANNER